MESAKVVRDVDKILLDSFWTLSDVKKHIRISSAVSIIRTLHNKQKQFSKVSDGGKSKELIYSLERLVKGLCSSRNAARQGYVLVLTELLKLFCEVSIEELLELVQKHLPLSNRQEKSPMAIGKLLVFSAVIRSGRLACDVISLPLIINALNQLSSERNYIQPASYTLILDIFSQITETAFKEHIWTELRKELSCGWDDCTPYILWLLLACQRKFPNVISSKFLETNWGNEDIFCEKNFVFLKKIIKQSTVVHPQFHPLCSELLLCLFESKELKKIWRVVIDGNLFESDRNEKAYLGFRMVKEFLTQKPFIEKVTGSNLNDRHNTKMVKYVLSSRFCSVFMKSLINGNHPLHSAAEEMASILCCFVKNTTNTKIQTIVLKAFLFQPLEDASLPQVLCRKEFGTIIMHLSPEALMTYLEMMKSIALGTKQSGNEENDSRLNQQRCTAALQIGTLVSHPGTICDIEWRIEIIKLLFLHSFFTIKDPTVDIPHCSFVNDLLPDVVRLAFSHAFTKALDSLNRKVDSGTASSQQLCSSLLSVVEYSQKLLQSPEYVTPIVSVEKLAESWDKMYNTVQKINERRKKKFKNLYSAFQILFLHLGLELYSDPENIPSILEELHVCYKKALKTKKQINEKNNNEPCWIEVVVDLMLSLLSRDSHHLRCVVGSAFSFICSFVTPESLQQILDVIEPEKTSEEELLVEDLNDDDIEEMEFDSGSSSDEDEQENNVDDNTKVSDLKLKLEKVLGSTVDASDAESDVVLTDTEMFKLDDALSDAFRSRKKVGHSQLNAEQKALLNFRLRCLDLIGIYLKSEPPMYLVIKCILPILSVSEFGLQSQHQRNLSRKAQSILLNLVKVKKFLHYENMDDTEMDDILQELFRKANKDKIGLQKVLCSLCVYMVLCKKKLCLLPGNKTNEEEKFKLTNSMKQYLLALDDFVKQNCHITPNMFTSFMCAFPEKAWEFVQPLQEYAFDEKIRLFKRAHCLGLLKSALSFSKAQESISSSVWLEFLKMLMPKAAESAKNVIGDHSNIKPLYTLELLNVIVTINEICKEKCNETCIEGHEDLITVLTSGGNILKKRLGKKGSKLKNKIVSLLGGEMPNAELTSNKKRKLSE